MKIGQLAEAAGVHVETIRYYQTLGLMPRPARAHGAVRRYGDEAVSRVRFINRAQTLGFSLDEAKLLLELSVRQHCAQTRTLPPRKPDLLEQNMAHLRANQGAPQKLFI